MRCGWHSSSSVVGMSSPYACCILHLRSRTRMSSRPCGGLGRLLMPATRNGGESSVVWLFHIDLCSEERFERQRDLDRQVEPLDEASLGKRKIIGVALTLLNAFALEHNDNSRFIRERVVLTHNPGLPEPPYICHLFR